MESRLHGRITDCCAFFFLEKQRGRGKLFGLSLVHAGLSEWVCSLRGSLTHQTWLSFCLAVVESCEMWEPKVQRSTCTAESLGSYCLRPQMVENEQGREQAQSSFLVGLVKPGACVCVLARASSMQCCSMQLALKVA